MCLLEGLNNLKKLEVNGIIRYDDNFDKYINRVNPDLQELVLEFDEESDFKKFDFLKRFHMKSLTRTDWKLDTAINESFIESLPQSLETLKLRIILIKSEFLEKMLRKLKNLSKMELDDFEPCPATIFKKFESI